MEIINEGIGERLDVYLTAKLNESRSFIIKQIKLGNIKVNDNTIKAGYIIKKEDRILIDSFKEDKTVSGEDIDLDIYYEDEYLMVVNKPTGMVVHPAPGNYKHTLVNALIHHTDDLSDLNGDNRPGIVHRIDKDTSGLLLISKTNEAHRILSDDFKYKRIQRKYIALVHGVINANKGKIEAPVGRDIQDRKKMTVTDINSKKAVTYFTVKERYNKYTLLELVLETGRTHQIRVHMSYIKHPVVNDNVYSNVKPINDYGQMLHAQYLGFNHPITHEFMEFEAPLEDGFIEILEKIKDI